MKLSHLIHVGMVLALALMAIPGQAAYIVRISDLKYSPTPPNPIKVVGTVASESPLKLSDGRGAITVSGITGTLGDLLVVQGNWDGSVLTVDPASLQEGYTKAPAVNEMAYVPSGSFLMGNSGVGDDAAWGFPSEFPQHSVYLSGYWIGKYDVTRGEYRQFINAGGYFNAAYWSAAGWAWRTSNNATQPQYYWDPVQNWGTGNFTQTDSFPVVGVIYYEAEAYCNWAGGHLPTEAQWEKAARWDGHPRIYPWGDTWDVEKCNNYYDHNPAGGGYEAAQTSPVGSYPAGASPYGCEDMAGNVWQWCQDWYKNYPGSANPFDYTGSYLVLRGCSWVSRSYYYDGYFRCAYRGYDTLGDTSFDYGFRLAR